MMDTNDNNNHLQSQFISLIQHSTSLLHRLDKNVDWSSIITAATGSSNNNEETKPSSSTQTINGGNAVLDNDNQDEDEDDDDDSSSDEDDMMMMLGGYSDSEDDESPSSKSNNNNNNTSNSDEDVVVIVEEDDAEYTLLKRASVVHSALLLSLPPPTKTSTTSTADGRKIVEQLISAILSGKSSKSTSTTTSSSSDEDKLVSTLSYIISSSSSSSTDNKQPIKTISAQRWKNVCLTNSLLVVQFLLHLMKQQNQSNTTATTSVLDEWNGIILPLLFGNNSFESSSSLFILNDALRDTLLNLSSFTTSSSSPCSIDQCQTTVNMCLSTLKQHVTSSTKEEQGGSSSRRQRYIIMVVCHVLIRLYDGIMSSSSSFQFKKDNEGGGVNNDKMLLDVVRYGMHQTVLLILRGICYYEAEGGGGKSMLSLESLRPITGMLLPKLYPNDDESSGGDGKGKSDVIVADERAVELWNEILLLLQPYSEDTQDDGKRRRCCQNWYVLC